MMKKILLIFVIALLAFFQGHAQVYYSKNGHIAFYSKTIVENIQADNNQVICVLNVGTGEIGFSLFNKGFRFPKAKMEEDFNEDYMESDTYPRSTFQGKINNYQRIDPSKNADIPVTVTGDLQIHGVTRRISTSGTISIHNGIISATASFFVLLKDYQIKVPTIIANKIAERIEVSIDCTYQKK